MFEPLLPFAQEIADRFKSMRSNVFLLTGNIHDLFPLAGRFAALDEYLEGRLFNPARGPGPEGEVRRADAGAGGITATRRKVVVTFDVDRGLAWGAPGDRAMVAAVVGDALLKRVEAEARQDAVPALLLLADLCRFEGAGAARERAEPFDMAVVLRYARALAPRGDNAALSPDDRRRVVLLERWFTAERFSIGNDLVLIVADDPADLNDALRRVPQLAHVVVPRPSDAQRRAYVRALAAQHGEKLPVALSEDDAVFYTGGLRLFDIQQMYLDALYRNEPLTAEGVFARMRELVEASLGDTIEVLRTNYGFERVVGAGRVVDRLREIVQVMRAGQAKLVPTGILVPGANGVGKTFVLKAFIRETGWLGVSLKNIRGAYVGETERNFERVRAVLEGMGRVVVLYDEADTEIGGRGRDTHDVDKRLFGAILRMMSDENNRGRIVWLIVTARPDRLEPDVKRSGRAGEHIAFFDPEGEERAAFVRHVLKGVGVDPALFDEASFASLIERTAGYSAADFTQLSVEIGRRGHLTGRLDAQTCLDACADFIPGDISAQRELQAVVAALECTDRRLLPERFRTTPKALLQEHAADLKAVIGER